MSSTVCLGRKSWSATMRASRSQAKRVATRTRRCCVDVTVSGEYLWQACTRSRHPVSGAAAGAAAAGRWQHNRRLMMSVQ